ncbi:hypothetical protein NQ314_010843 [Rhamnusium bicolor]|uniref:GRIP domain-containing protein n=1 Tax=Rhamnusium bicolor TaxID=1586634 RepID=A0AAV8XN39_9CUCU|nr:hypothetical protein NQ314_010843 [Rhamnusium bicolor]
MEPSVQNEPKKVNLEELSKEDLVKKCKNLLMIAQKAKQTKNVLQEENTKLKQELKELTQQKLCLVTTIEDLKAKNSSLDSKLQIFEKELRVCQEKFDATDNENVSYKRQVTRLTDENEQLITHLESLEKQIDELNKIGIQQQEQLLELESKSQESKPIVGENKITELQCMLSVSLEEVKKLKTQNLVLNEKVENLHINLSEKDKNIIVISEELKSKCDILKEVTQELKELKEANNDIIKDYDKHKLQCKELSKAIELNEDDISTSEKPDGTIKDLENVNNRLKEKLKLYHSKIIKFAGSAKALKEEKNNILQLFKLYTDQVKNWKEQLDEAGQKLVTHVNQIDLENLKLKESINTLKREEGNRLLEKRSAIESELYDATTNFEKQLEVMKCRNEVEAEALKNQLIESESYCSSLSKDVANTRKIVEEFKNQIELLNTEKEDINKTLLVLKNTNVDLTNEIISVKEENASLVNKLEEYELKYLNLKKETECILTSNREFKNEIDLLTSEKKSINIINKEREASHIIQLEIEQKKLLDCEKLICSLKTQLRKYEDDREHIEATEKQLAERSCEEIKKLVQENRELVALNNALQEKVDHVKHKQLNVSNSECQTGDDLISSSELEEQIINLKRENAELLSEMNEMNQAIKERGENISKLEAHCEEVMKKLQIYETQANKNIDSITEKEEIIKNLTLEIESLKLNKNSDINFNDKVNSGIDDEIHNLKSEIEVLKEKLNSNMDTSYAESETMSTSTMSRTEDINRLKDLEGSWEERYGKLRSLAIKLKGKIRELSDTLTKEQSEKDDLQKKLTVNINTIQVLQNQSDKLEDELENSKQECRQYLNRLNTIAEDISKDKQSLVSKEDIIGELKKEIEDFKNDKQITENWKKQVSAKVQTLRKELEANIMLKKEFENKITKLTAELEAKEQALKFEMECHKQTKNLLDLSNNECKKNSVLSLEMQDYERSVKETSKKLEKQQDQISKLKGQVDSQKSTISALREQIKLLEERVQEEESNFISAAADIDNYKKKVAQLEEEIQQKDDKVQNLTQLLENSRSENEELSTELSKVIAEHQKTNNILKNERDHLRSQMIGLQQHLREVQDSLKLKEDELKIIRNEYDGYKVRAQSVLRQNQNRDVGQEEKLSEEMASLKLQNSKLSNQLEKHIDKLKVLEETNEKLTFEEKEALKRIQELEMEIDDQKKQYTQLFAMHQNTLSEHAETVRSLKVHADTLSQCYRQQIADQEIRHNREIIELQSRIEKAPSPVETTAVLSTMTREEGEGSESIESNNVPNVHPVPLERLLGSDSDQEVVYLKKQLNEQESKLSHLTALLADTEQDLAKHVQMNKLLKEEIRRQQRSVEREKHAENLEYLKNVVFKFVTLNSGDERTRLVPVLNTILKLSPEETQKLNMVAKGDTGLKGWTNYLPTWSSPNKP